MKDKKVLREKTTQINCGEIFHRGGSNKCKFLMQDQCGWSRMS